jgi:hypothetical protein
MLPAIYKTTVPKNKLWIADYSNLDPDAEGQVKSILYGHKHNIVPVCINIATGQYMIAGHAIKAIDEIRIGDETLVLNTDYTEDLANGKFTLQACPLLQPATQYYFVLESDYAIDGVNYLKIAQKPVGDYADGQHYFIDNVGAWSAQSSDICFRAWGRSNLSDSDFDLITYPINKAGWAGWNWEAYFRDAAARTRMAQGFMLPAWATDPVYLTRLLIFAYLDAGAPVGNLYLRILSAYNPAELQVGSRSYRVAALDIGDWDNDTTIHFANFPLRELGNNQVVCDAQGKPTADTGAPLMMNAADIIKDILGNECDVPASQFNAADFTALEAAKTEELALYINAPTEVEAILDRIESGQLFRIVNDDEGKIAPQLFQTGEPAGTLHFKDEDIGSFKMVRDFGAVRRLIQVKYDEDPSAGGSSDSSLQFPYVEATSDLAKYGYGVDETMEIETYLKTPANATALAVKLSDLFETPTVWVFLEIANQGFELIPGSKIKITRARAAYAGGTLNAVLFRIISIQKRVGTKSVIIDAILDTQTY